MSIISFYKRPLVKRLFKIVLAAFATFLLFLCLAFFYFLYNKDAIKEALLNYVREHQTGEILIGDIQFSPLSGLPDVAIRLDSVWYYEHLAENRPEEEVPILALERVYLAFDLLPLFSGNYDISEIALTNGTFNVIHYKDNTTNLFNALGIGQVKREKINEGRPPPPDIELDLEELRFRNLSGHFYHEGIALDLEMAFQRLSAGLKYKEGIDDIRLDADLKFRALQLEEQTYLQNKKIRLDLDLLLDENTRICRIEKSKVVFQGLEFDLSGDYTFDETGWADLTLDASDEDLTLFSYLIEDEFLDDNLDILRKGNLSLSGSIRGETVNHLPEIEFFLGAENISIDIPGQEKGIRDLGFSAWLNTGEADDFSEARLRLSDLNGVLPGGGISGKLAVENFADPVMTASGKVEADLKGWDKVFRLGGLKDLSGRIALAANIKDQRISDSRELLESLDTIRLDLTDVAFKMPGFSHRIEQLNASLTDRANKTVVHRLSGRYGNSDLAVNGVLSNFLYYLFNRSSNMRAELAFASQEIHLKEWPVWKELSPDPGDLILNGLKSNISIRTGNKRDLSEAFLGGDLSFRYGQNSRVDLTAVELKNLVDPLLSGRAEMNNLELEPLTWALQPFGLDSLSGALSLTADLEGWALRSKRLPAKINELKLNFRNACFHQDVFPRRFERLTGLLTGKQNRFELSDLDLHYGRSHLQVDGRLENLAARLAGRDAALKAELRLTVDEAKWNEWPFFDTLSKGISGERVTGLTVDLALLGQGPATAKFPWSDKWRTEIHGLKGDFDLMPDIDDLKAVFTLDLADSSALQIDIDRLELDLRMGEIELKGGTVRIGEERVFADTDLATRNLQIDKLREILAPSGESSLSENAASLIDVQLPLKGSYHFRERAIKDLRITSGDLRYQFGNSGFVFLEDTDLILEEAVFNLPRAGNSPLSAIEGEVSVGKLKSRRLENTGVRCRVEGREDYYFFKGSLYQFAEVREEGALEIDLRGEKPVIKMNYDLEDFPIELLVGNFYPTELISGPVDVSLDLTTQGREAEEWILHAGGSLSIDGHGLLLHGVDLDELLKRYQRTQNFNLVDISAVVLAGPFGAVVTKGMDFGRVFDMPFAPGQRTEIPRMTAEWDFKDGIVQTRDVAFTTSSSRIAVDGLINMGLDSIDHIRVAVIDEKGCSLIDQTISGKYDSLQTGELNVAGVLLGAVINVFELVTGPQCEPVYTGSVAHP